jgi:hypothetical protein
MRLYTVACPGFSRYDEAQRKQMDARDPRVHQPGGWNSETFPVRCPDCGDPAQPRGAFEVLDLL